MSPIAQGFYQWLDWGIPSTRSPQKNCLAPQSLPALCFPQNIDFAIAMQFLPCKMSQDLVYEACNHTHMLPRTPKISDTCYISHISRCLSDV